MAAQPPTGPEPVDPPPSSAPAPAPTAGAANELAALFEATFEQAAVGMAHVSMTGEWLRVNRRLCEILGYGAAELRTLRWQDITHPEDLAADAAQAERLIRGEIDAYTIEKRYIRGDGSPVWAALTGSVLRGGDGRPAHFIAVVEDITRRKLAEAALAEQHEALERERRKLRTVLDVLPAGVWIADAEGRIEVANRGAAAIWGGSAPATGDPALYHEEYRAFWPDGRPVSAGEWGLARAVQRGERSGPEEVLIDGFDGVRRTILNYGVPIRDDAGDVTGAVALSVDITDRKRAEAELRTANERLSLLLRSAAGLLASENPRDFLQELFALLERHLGVAAYFNYLVEEGPAGARLRLDSTRGVTEADIAPYRSLEFGSAVCGTVAQNGEKWVLESVQDDAAPETELLRALGISAYACHPLVGGGELVGTLSFGLRGRKAFTTPELDLLQAISDHVAVAIQRSRTRDSEHMARLEAERAMRTRSDFVATVSHELRTPLNAVIGYTQLLEDGIPAPLDERHLASVQRIRLSARHLQQLIEDILAFSRLDAGREEVSVEEVRLDELAQEVRAVIEPLAATRQLAFTLHAEEAPAQVRTDPRKLRQILLNLLGNAVKFTERGRVSLELRGVDDQLHCTVSDTGIGIDAAHRDRLFEPFWQANASRTRRSGGTGLGLSISRRYARLLGGDISVESTPGEGTRFELRIPTDGGSPS